MAILLGISLFIFFIPKSLLISSIVYITTSFSYATDIVAVYPLLYLHGVLLFFVLMFYIEILMRFYGLNGVGLDFRPKS
jgi:hypothetical protein